MSTATDPGLNPRQMKFVHLFTGGMAAGRAYEAAGYACKGHAADVAASRLLTNVDIRKAMKDVRRALSESDRWEKWQMLDFHQAVLETPIGELDENSVLVQEVTTDEIGEAVIRKKIKMVGKMDSAKEFAKLMGWYAPEKLELDASDELADLIRETRAGR